MDYPLVRAAYILRWCDGMRKSEKNPAVDAFLEKWKGQPPEFVAENALPKDSQWSQQSWDQLEIDLFGATTARLLGRGYAPGGYMCKCTQCKSQFIGDKRAVRCLPCAKHEWEASVQE